MKTKSYKQILEILDILENGPDAYKYIGHIYKIIEEVKFPYLKGQKWTTKSKCNVYARQQYYNVMGFLYDHGVVEFRRRSGEPTVIDKSCIRMCRDEANFFLYRLAERKAKREEERQKYLVSKQNNYNIF